MSSLFGEEFKLPDTKEETKKIIRQCKSKKRLDVSVDKQLKSKDLPIKTRLDLITKEVYRVLGKQVDNTIIIKTKEELDNYIDVAINNGVFALDTETNNTLDYISCKLMGPCFYTPGMKQAYIPINHINFETGERLSWQLTEEDIRKALLRLINNNVKFIFHNYKFDYQVIKTTCHLEVPAFWDTMIGAKMIDENLKAGLKALYCTFIDPEQEKYDIETLFDTKNGIRYEQVDPNIFALYAATDSMMTYRLYLYEKDILEQNKYKGMYNIFKTIEMPIIKVIADMEYRGIGLDIVYLTRLSKKYHKKLDNINKELNEELSKLQPKIDTWKLTSEATEKTKKYASEEDKYNKTFEKRFPYKDDKGFYKLDKSKAEQLDNPINLDSPSQLAILLFDILKFPEGLGQTVDDKPRSTGSNVLDILAKKYDFKLGELLASKKALDKILNTFIDAFEKYVNPTDGKIHTQFNQLGAIARFSSNNPNLQNIPSSLKDIRPVFCVDEGYVLVGADLSAAEVRASVVASEDPDMMSAYKDGLDLYSKIGSMAFHTSYEDCLENYVEGTVVEVEGKSIVAGNEKTYIEEDINNIFTIPYFRLVNTTTGFIPASELTLNNILITDEGNKIIKNITTKDKNVVIEVG